MVPFWRGTDPNDPTGEIPDMFEQTTGMTWEEHVKRPERERRGRIALGVMFMAMISMVFFLWVDSNYPQTGVYPLIWMSLVICIGATVLAIFSDRYTLP